MHIDYISTKFYIPVAPDRYVVRQRLVDKLRHQEGIRLSLLTAPAGFGKTTTVIHAINDLNASPDQPPVKVAWLSLDEHDNGFVEFVSYFIGSVQQVESDFAYDLQVSMSSGQQPAIATVATELINQLARLDTPLHLVLDDFHVITDLDISELMNLMVEYLPPHIHFMITSRKPLAFDLPRWRGRGWLNEVEAKHLRFTLPETEAFLHNTMQLAEVADIVKALQDHTEGWVVGLQLAAFSIRESDDQQAFLDRFSGATKTISDYLMAEVFAKQSAQIQDFLLKTSITDKFTAGLCAAIVGIDISLAHTILDTLAKSDLFLMTLDDQGYWFQYHKLFWEFLERQRQVKLVADSISALHRNAAQWYGEQDFIVKAVDHSLLVGDYDEAVRWIGGVHFEQVWEQSIGSKFLTWIPQFPKDELKKHPQLVVAAAGAFLVRSEGQLLREMLEFLQEFEETENEYNLFMGVILRGSDQEGALDRFHQVVEATPKENVFYHFALSQIGVVLMEMGELKQATEVLTAFSEDYVALRIPQAIIWMQVINVLSSLHFVQGQLHEAEAVVGQGFDYVSSSQNQTPLVGLLHHSMGQIHWMRNELDEAEKHYREALRWGELSGTADILHTAFVGMSNILLARYDEDALVQLDQGYDIFRENGTLRGLQQRLEARKAFVHLNLDHHVDAIRWADASGFSSNDVPSYQNHALYQIYVAVRLRQFYDANDKDELAYLLPLVEVLQRQAQTSNHIHHYLNCLIAKSIIYDRVGRKQSSQDALTEALDLLEKAEFLRVFLLWRHPLHTLLMDTMATQAPNETMRRLLLALSNQPGMEQAGRTGVGESTVSLTNREMEILTLIAMGLTNKKIADQLVISENTLRTHVRNLYRKLGVNNRTQAMKAGQELGLL